MEGPQKDYYDIFLVGYDNAKYEKCLSKITGNNGNKSNSWYEISFEWKDWTKTVTHNISLQHNGDSEHGPNTYIYILDKTVYVVCII